jgi:hypothetical protein
MQTHAALDPNDATLQMGPLAPRMIVSGLVAAGVGIAVALSCTPGGKTAASFFHHAYLVAFVFYLMITLGSLFFVMLHHLARSGWSVTLRRVAEALSGNMLLMAVLFIPVAMGLHVTYQWADRAEPNSADAKHDAEWTSGSVRLVAATGENPVADIKKDKSPASEMESGDESPHSKAVVGHRTWLTPRAFLGRFAIYFVIWIFLAWYFRGHSILQDSTGSVSLSRSMERTAAPGMLLFAVTLTLAAVDLIMSLNPHWYSTMIGVYLFSDAVLASLVAITLLSLLLQACGRLRGAVTIEHYHDLGKLTFGFVFFWGYIAFSQYMLIWYANMPEETQFYMPRQIGPWVAVSLALIVVHFVLPFLGLMSKHVKRFLPLHAFWLVWLLAASAFDLFWLIMPNTYVRAFPGGESLPEAFKTLLESQQSVYQLSPEHQSLMELVKLPLTPAGLATVAGLLVFMGGLYIASTGWLLGRARLVAVKDPRLNESLSFHNA